MVKDFQMYVLAHLPLRTQIVQCLAILNTGKVTIWNGKETKPILLSKTENPLNFLMVILTI
jgi:hypothetical protein